MPARYFVRIRFDVRPKGCVVGTQKNSGVVMTKQVLLASVFAVGTLALPASAGDWNGFYIGLNAGGAFGDTDWTNVSNTTPGGARINFVAPQTIAQSPNGVLAGGQIGYNYQSRCTG